MDTLTTLPHHLYATSLAANLKNDLARIFGELGLVGRILHSEVNRAGIRNIIGGTGGKNVHGDHVQKLDCIAHDLLVAYLSRTGLFAALASEEEEDIMETGTKDAPYVCCFDPLDGSSNIDCNIPIGTIFSIYRRLSTAPISEKDFLQKGISQLCAGYILYGVSTIFVYTVGKGTHGFTYDPFTTGEYILSSHSMHMPEGTKYYSINDGYEHTWRPWTKTFIEQCRDRGFSQRYVGTLVADAHRTLVYGGVFLNPVRQGEKQAKLRLVYECNPIAFLTEQAGGAAHDGTMRILEKVPGGLHDRSGVVMGSRDLVEEARKFYNEGI